MKQYIYQLDREAPLEAPSLGNARFFHVISVLQAIGLTRYLVSLIGVARNGFLR